MQLATRFRYFNPYAVINRLRFVPEAIQIFIKTGLGLGPERKHTLIFRMLEVDGNEVVLKVDPVEDIDEFLSADKLEFLFGMVFRRGLSKLGRRVCGCFFVRSIYIHLLAGSSSPKVAIECLHKGNGLI